MLSPGNWLLNPCQIELPSPTRTMYEIRQGAATVQLNVASLKMLPPTPHPLAARTPPTTYMAGASGHPNCWGLGTQPSGTESGQSPGTVSPPEKSSKKRAQLGGLVGDGVGERVGPEGVGVGVGSGVGSEVVGVGVGDGVGGLVAGCRATQMSSNLTEVQFGPAAWSMKRRLVKSSVVAPFPWYRCDPPWACSG